MTTTTSMSIQGNDLLDARIDTENSNFIPLVELSDPQWDIVKSVYDRSEDAPRAIAVYGPPGSGKSQFIKGIMYNYKHRKDPLANPLKRKVPMRVNDIPSFKDKLERPEICVITQAAIAAEGINGTTYNSILGIPPGRSFSNFNDIDKFITRKKKNNPTSVENLSAYLDGIKILIIDEISMIHRRDFYSLSLFFCYFTCKEKFRNIRGLKNIEEIAKQLPFFGDKVEKVLLVGDPFQLPPVELKTAEDFSFNCPLWRDHVEGNEIILSVNYRSSTNLLTRVIEYMRWYGLNKTQINQLRAYTNTKDHPTDVITDSVCISSHKHGFDAHNKKVKDTCLSEMVRIIRPSMCVSKSFLRELLGMMQDGDDDGSEMVNVRNFFAAKHRDHLKIADRRKLSLLTCAQPYPVSSVVEECLNKVFITKECYVDDETLEKDKQALLNLLDNTTKNGYRNEKDPVYLHSYYVKHVNPSCKHPGELVYPVVRTVEPRFFPLDEPEVRQKFKNALEDNEKAPQHFLGGKLMFVQNNSDKGYINGKMCTVVGEYTQYLEVIDEKGQPKEICARCPIVQLVGKQDQIGMHVELLQEKVTQYVSKDLKLVHFMYHLAMKWAYILTCHKVQGTEFDASEKIVINVTEFCPHIGMVAMSRAKAIENLIIKCLELQEPDSFVVQYMKKLHERLDVPIPPKDQNIFPSRPSNTSGQKRTIMDNLVDKSCVDEESLFRKLFACKKLAI